MVHSFGVLQKFFLFVLRVATGWMFFYAGITKVLDPQWSATGYLKGAKAFTWLFQMLLDPSVLPIVNFMNKWGLTLLGASLILGFCLSASSSLLGVMLMALYYIPLGFPIPIRILTLWTSILFISPFYYFSPPLAPAGFSAWTASASTITPDLKSGWDKIMITFNDFQKIEIKIGAILSAEKVEGSEKLQTKKTGEEIVLMKPSKKVLSGSKLG